MSPGDAAEAALREGTSEQLAAPTGGAGFYQRPPRPPPLGTARFVYAMEAAPALARVAHLLPEESPVAAADGIAGLRRLLAPLPRRTHVGGSQNVEEGETHGCSLQTPLDVPRPCRVARLTLRELRVDVPTQLLTALRAVGNGAAPPLLALRVAPHGGRCFVGPASVAALSLIEADARATTFAPRLQLLQLSCPQDARCALAFELLLMPHNAAAAGDVALASALDDAAVAAWGAALPFRSTPGATKPSLSDGEDEGEEDAGDLEALGLEQRRTDDASDTDEAGGGAACRAEGHLLSGAYALRLRGGPGKGLRDPAPLDWRPLLLRASGGSNSGGGLVDAATLLELAPVLRFSLDDVSREAHEAMVAAARAEHAQLAAWAERRDAAARAEAAAAEADARAAAAAAAAEAEAAEERRARAAAQEAAEREAAALAAAQREEAARAAALADDALSLTRVAEQQAAQMDALSAQLRSRLARLSAADRSVEEASQRRREGRAQRAPSAETVSEELSEQIARLLSGAAPAGVLIGGDINDAVDVESAGSSGLRDASPIRLRRARDGSVRDRATQRAAAAPADSGDAMPPPQDAAAAEDFARRQGAFLFSQHAAVPFAQVDSTHAAGEAPVTRHVDAIALPRMAELQLGENTPADEGGAACDPSAAPPPARSRSGSPARVLSGRIKYDRELGALLTHASSLPVASADAGAVAAGAAAQAHLSEVCAERERRKHDIILTALRNGLPEAAERSAAPPGSTALVRRTFDVSLRAGEPAFAKIVHVNGEHIPRTFLLRTSHPAVVALSPERAAVPPGTSIAVAVTLAPAEQWKLASDCAMTDVLLFVNDEFDVSEAVFKLRVRAPLPPAAAE